jgi:Uma2 family endonuclease
LLNRTRSDGKGVVCFYFFEKLKIFQKNKNKPLSGFYAVSCIVVPDLSFVPNANAAYLQPSGYILGVPDLIVEILSKGTHQVDRGDKMRLYRRYGVKEYWLVDPIKKSIEIYVLEGDEYILTAYAEEFSEINSRVLTGFCLEIAKVFV